MFLTPSLCCGARALLKWPRARLALQAKLSKTTIFNYELLRRTMSPTSKAGITRALRGAGVDLSPSSKGSDAFALMVVNRQEDSLTGLPAADLPGIA